MIYINNQEWSQSSIVGTTSFKAIQPWFLEQVANSSQRLSTPTGPTSTCWQCKNEAVIDSFPDAIGSWGYGLGETLIKLQATSSNLTPKMMVMVKRFGGFAQHISVGWQNNILHNYIMIYIYIHIMICSFGTSFAGSAPSLLSWQLSDPPSFLTFLLQNRDGHGNPIIPWVFFP